MRLKVSDLFSWKGTIERGPFFIWAVVLAGIKFQIDRHVAGAFGRAWYFADYVVNTALNWHTRPGANDAAFFGTLVACSLPFLWAGLVLTLKRIRAAALPPWMVVLFVVPGVKLIFFVVLCLAPDRSERPAPNDRDALLSALIPRTATGGALAGIVATAALAMLVTWLSTRVMLAYGWSLFVGLPFCAGFTSAMIYGYHNPRSLGGCLLVSMYALAFAAAGFLAFALEGLICILMAAPLAIPFALLGGAMAYAVQNAGCSHRESASMLSAVMFLAPLGVGIEHAPHAASPQFAVTSTVDIDAPPERVWKNVVCFSEITARPGWMFRSGIACPVRARIEGRGVGAVRYCEFSTGSFVEPIDVWDEPRLLKFGVTQNPPPMKELSPYRDLHPPHLDHFMTSDAGQFKLVALPDGRTRLEGTTWYHHGLWPAGYWRLWSDFIIHRIHLRVLTHVKELSERY